MTIEVGQILRYREYPDRLWLVRRLTDKTAWVANCDGKGDAGPHPRDWPFRIKTVERDFFPA